MKKSYSQFALLFIMLISFSCSRNGCTDPTANNYDKKAKKDNGTCEYDSQSSTAPCGDGIDFCMEVDGISKSGPAKLNVFNGSEYSVTWFSQDSSEYCNLYVIDGTSAGDYAITANGGQGTYATFGYHKTSGYVKGDTGLVTVTQFDTIAGFSGSFNVDLEDGSTIANGHFTEVKK